MMLFKRVNSIAGWLCFAIAAVTYLLTIEPSASLWDCGEFISTGYKLEVGHAPGNAIFSLLTRLFTMLAFGNVAMVAVMANIMSALCSAFTILFLFWTITHLGRKLIIHNDSDYTLANIVGLIGAGAIGSLAFTFSDTFWFSAVEGEVYAMSSLCTAIIFWAILKWEDRADEPYANRWIILIGLMLGLSIGVHLLNLLTIPALALVYYYRKYRSHSFWGTVGVFLLSCVIVAITMFLIPTIPTIASWFELLFVNVMHLPYNSGAIVGFFIIMGLLFWACYETWKRRKVLMNTIALFITLFVIGFSACIFIVIRSDANPPINENAPDNMFSLIYYLNRAQFGAPPLIYGRTYASNGSYEEDHTYTKKNGCYEKVDVPKYEQISTTKVVYDHQNDMLFPRLYDPNAFEDYKNWVELTDVKTKPTSAQNMKYLFSYQLDWMYLRYFFWNFAGRQNDIQGYGGPMYGNWVSGIKPLDNARITGLDDQPEFLKNNKGNNHYYLIPFILGIIGLGYQLARNPRQWFMLATLFFFTGIAIVLYLNQTPGQPRERDYAYVGSFYVYAIWIGLGVLAFYELFVKKAKVKAIAAASLATVICASAPVLMGQQNWDDHNRSGRHIAHDVAYNYLMSCEPNAILFTVGDNDTFPLWYMQEVEGVRTDVRVVCLSLLNADWYIDQMRVKTYQSEPLPITIDRSNYRGEENNEVVIVERVKEPVDLKWMMDFAGDPKNKADFGINKPLSYLPSRKVSLPVDKQAALASGTVKEKDASLMVDTVYFDFSTNVINKAQLVILDMMANNGWKRPIHFTSLNGDASIGFKNYLQYNGFSYKLEPIKSSGDPNDLKGGRADSEWLYEYLMNTCRWGNMGSEEVHIDHFYMTTLARIIDVRGMFANLALQLIEEGKPDKAKEVLARVTELMPRANFPYCMGYYPSDMAMPNIVKALYETDQADKAKALTKELFLELQANVGYFLPISANPIIEAQVTVVTIQDLWRIAKLYGDKEAEEQLGGMLRMLHIIE